MKKLTCISIFFDFTSQKFSQNVLLSLLSGRVKLLPSWKFADLDYVDEIVLPVEKVWIIQQTKIRLVTDVSRWDI